MVDDQEPRHGTRVSHRAGRRLSWRRRREVRTAVPTRGPCCRRPRSAPVRRTRRPSTHPVAPNPSSVSCTVAVLSQTSTSPHDQGIVVCGHDSITCACRNDSRSSESPLAEPDQPADGATEEERAPSRGRVHPDHRVGGLEDEPAIVVGSACSARRSLTSSRVASGSVSYTCTVSIHFVWARGCAGSIRPATPMTGGRSTNARSLCQWSRSCEISIRSS